MLMCFVAFNLLLIAGKYKGDARLYSVKEY